MRAYLILPLLLGVSLPVQAGVDPKVHKLCKDVKDYQGCVKAQTGENKSQNKKVFGNKCPEGYAYMGQGICNIVQCQVETNAYSNFFSNHDDLLAGKSTWKCKYHAFWGPGHLRVGSASVGIGNDLNCPTGQPAIGWNSTCEAPYISKKKNKLPMACRNGVWDKDHPKCQRSEIKIPSPMDMD